MTDLRQDADGIAVTVTWQGASYQLRAPLFGLHQGRNIALAFAAACTLGIAPEDVVASLRTTPQIAHRLEVKRQGNGAVLVDDAYNSNPVGFASALDLLDVLRRPGGRRILVTPGMVELGAAHDEEHRRIGGLAAAHVDVLVAVAPHRVAPLADAFAVAAPKAEIVSCPGFAEAQEWMAQQSRRRRRRAAGERFARPARAEIAAVRQEYASRRKPGPTDPLSETLKGGSGLRRGAGFFRSGSR